MIAWASNTFVLPPEKRDTKAAAEGKAQLEQLFLVLEGALAPQAHRVGDAFTVADLNLAAVIFRARQMDLGATPRVGAWLERCLSRPAAAAALRLRGG